MLFELQKLELKCATASSDVTEAEVKSADELTCSTWRGDGGRLYQDIAEDSTGPSGESYRWLPPPLYEMGSDCSRR